MGQTSSYMGEAAYPEPSSFKELVAMLPDALHREMHVEWCEDMEDSDYILTEVCVGLRRHRNRFAPIDRLPPEIFSYIFEYVVQPDSDRTVKSQKAATERIPEMWALLALSQVCSRWRAIALQTPTLWTHVDNRHEATLEAYLTRSGTMPLRLHMFPGMPNERVDRLLQQHGHRVRRFDCVEGPPWGHRSPDFPHSLECLTVAADCDYLGDDEHEGVTHLCVVSHLKALALQPFCSTIFGTSFPSLTHLYLSPFHERPPSEGVMQDLMDLLSNTPVLQYLHLSRLQMRSIFASISPPVTLRSLRALTCLDSDVGAALRFLESLELPEDALVRLDGLQRVEGDLIDDLRTCPIPSRDLVESFDHLEVVTDENHLQVVAQGTRSGLWIRAKSFVVSYNVHPPNSEDHWTTWVTTLGAMLSLASIRTLHICVLDPALLPELLPLLPNLVELAVRINPGSQMHSESTCQSLLERLYATLAAEESVCCPLLQVLAVEIPSDNPGHFRLSGTPGKLGPDTALEMARSRSRMGAPLHRLALQLHCESPTQRMETLEDFESALAPYREHVAAVEVVYGKEPKLCPFEMRDMWNADGAEEYWGLAPDDQPKYRLPWNPGLEDSFKLRWVY
ncbi:hypothetical protein VTO73DRAFT_8011 [Trametes versicolor]